MNSRTVAEKKRIIPVTVRRIATAYQIFVWVKPASMAVKTIDANRTMIVILGDALSIFRLAHASRELSTVRSAFETTTVRLKTACFSPAVTDEMVPTASMTMTVLVVHASGVLAMGCAKNLKRATGFRNFYSDATK